MKIDATRTCLGCRTKRKQRDMIRIVRHPEGDAVFDLDGRLPGRGAYVCPLPACLGKLTSSSLTHHLKGKAALPDFPRLREDLVCACEIKVRNLLSIGLKSGQVRVGSHAVAEVLRSGRAALLVLADDSAPRTQRRLLRLAEPLPVMHVTDKKRLGSWLGRFTAGSAAVKGEGLASKLVRLHERLTSIEGNSYHATQT